MLQLGRVCLTRRFISFRAAEKNGAHIELDSFQMLIHGDVEASVSAEFDPFVEALADVE